MMKRGSLRPSIVLPRESVDAGYCPDGLSENDIDVLLAESGMEIDPMLLSESTPDEVPPVVTFPADECAPVESGASGEAA